MSPRVIEEKEVNKVQEVLKEKLVHKVHLVPLEQMAIR